jgi:hypothetical protein
LFGVHVSLAKKLGNESLNVARNYEDPPAPFSPNLKVILLICTFSEHKLAIERLLPCNGVPQLIIAAF